MNIALSNMERDKLKLIVRNLKLLVDALESEVYSDVEAYTVKEDYVPPLADYEEVFEDDEWPSVNQSEIQSSVFESIDEKIWWHPVIKKYLRVC